MVSNLQWVGAPCEMRVRNQIWNIPKGSPKKIGKATPGENPNKTDSPINKKAVKINML